MVDRTKILYPLALLLLAASPLLAATAPAQLARALTVQRELVAEQPANAGALNDLANLLVEAGELQEAEETYRRAMALAPELAEPPFNLALLLSATDQPREARRLLQALLEQHPEHAWGHYQLGTLQQVRGNRGRALRHYREAFRLDPRLSDPHHNPHVLDNPLATAAMLEAFSQIAHAKTGQRLYVEPSRITDLLLSSPLTAAPAEPMEEPAEPMEEPPIEEVKPAQGMAPQAPPESPPAGDPPG